MSKKVLTEVALRAAQAPEIGRLTLWDGVVKHFGVRITPAGVMTFIVLLGSGRRQAIGRYPVLSLAQAREKAKRILAERTLGRHQSSSISWQVIVEKFIEARSARTRPGTVAEYERSLKRYFGFGTTRLSDITKQDISRKLEKLNRTPSQQGHALVTCKMLFRWALVQGYIDIDPTAAFRRNRTRRRTRVLSDAELKSIWEACETNRLVLAQHFPAHFGTIVQLLMLTGQRRGEIAGLKGIYYSHNQQTLCLPGEVTKNRREHTFPLGQLAVAFLQINAAEPEFCFPARGKPDRPFNGWSNSKAALDELSGVTKWRLHDLRRTFRTIHGRIGTPPHIAERLINHVNGVASDVEQTYDIWTYLPEMRKAMHAYEAELTRIFAVETADRQAA